MTEPQPDAPVAPEAPAEDLASRAAELQAELTQVRSDLMAAGGDVTRLKVEGVHEAFQFGHILVGTDFTPVPAAAVPDMMEAAANAGVTLTQEAS
jgi:hypothetical protein